jgi:hypothetical protein
MTLAPRLAALALPALLLAAPARADVVAAPFLLQGSVTYDCFGCAPGATFTGVSTVVHDGVAVTVPVAGVLTSTETCDATGGASGTFYVGPDEYTFTWTRAGAAAVVTGYGPIGAFQTEAGAGTLVVDAPPGTCGIPVTATLTAPLVPVNNCACVIAGDG